MPTSDAQKKATQAYRERNREKTRRQSYLSTAKSYINTATPDELTDLLDLIKERMERTMRSYTIDERTVYLTQEAYLAGTNDNPHYEAAATDMDGTKYQVRWSILDDYDPTVDQEDAACDWDKPVSIDPIK